MSKYTHLSRANLTYDYLHSNSTTHEFLFGALAEIVDNSRDAEAENLKIYTMYDSKFRGNYILCFLDDGTGMDPMEASEVIQFGSSSKKASEKNLIGQYGNGLKSGSMRIGKDLLIFTKKNDLLTILFMSDTFLRQEKIKEIVVPLPSFDNVKKSPWLNPTLDQKLALEKHNLEMEIIYKYTPFKNLQQIHEQFDKIENQGTLVMIFNLQLMIDGRTELDFETDKEDILMTDLEVDYDRKTQLEHKSFRAYASILYSNPRMKIYIQNKKVQTKILTRSLYQTASFSYSSNKFKVRALKEKEKAEQDLKDAKNELREAISNLAEFENKNGSRLSQSLSIELTKLRRAREKAENEVNNKKLILDKRIKEINGPKELSFIFGINIHNRDADGLFIYNCNRLIIMFEHTKIQKKNSEYRGIVGIVNVPYLVSQPTHNKQQFADSNEQRQLICALGDYMDSYYTYLNRDLNRNFWREFGYFSSQVEKPSDEECYARKRLQYSKVCLQCSSCLKWRVLRWHPKIADKSYYKDNWTCADNTDPNLQSCHLPEKFEDFPKVEYHKIQETNFIEAEEKRYNKKKEINLQAHKQQALLIQKDRNETIDRTIPPPISKTSSQSSSLNDELSSSNRRAHEPVSYAIDSDSESSVVGSKRNSNDKENINNKRKRGNDDDPTFSLTRRNISSSSNNRRSIENRPKSSNNDNLYDTEEYEYVVENESDMIIIENVNRSNIKIETDFQSSEVEFPNNDRENFIDPDEPNLHSNENIANNLQPELRTTTNNNDNNINNYNDDSTKNTIIENYKHILTVMASFSKETQPMIEHIKKYNNEQLAELSINDFLNKFRESLVATANKKIKKTNDKMKIVAIDFAIREKSSSEFVNGLTKELENFQKNNLK